MTDKEAIVYYMFLPPPPTFPGMSTCLPGAQQKQVAGK